MFDFSVLRLGRRGMRRLRLDLEHWIASSQKEKSKKKMKRGHFHLFIKSIKIVCKKRSNCNKLKNLSPPQQKIFFKYVQIR